jgi:hypothetical protein
MRLVAEEFEKVAPAPGFNWHGTADQWLGNAYEKGWIVKTAPLSAVPGAIILGVDADQRIWAGIVRAVDKGNVTFDYAGAKGQLTRYTADAKELTDKFHLVGYIWPQKAS